MAQFYDGDTHQVQFKVPDPTDTQRILELLVEIKTQLGRLITLAETQAQFDVQLQQFETDEAAFATIAVQAMSIAQQLLKAYNALVAQGQAPPIDLSTEGAAIASIDATTLSSTPQLQALVTSMQAALAPPTTTSTSGVSPSVNQQGTSGGTPPA